MTATIVWGERMDDGDASPPDLTPGDEVIYVEVTQGVFAPVNAAEAQWRAAAHARPDAPGRADPVEPTAPDAADAHGTPTTAELLDPASPLTAAERWAGLVEAAAGMTIEEKQRAAVALLRTGMTDDQIETALNALFPPSPGPSTRGSG